MVCAGDSGGPDFQNSAASIGMCQIKTKNIMNCFVFDEEECMGHAANMAQ